MLTRIQNVDTETLDSTKIALKEISCVTRWK